MIISFENPWWLVLIPFLLFFTFYFGKRLSRLGKQKRRLILGIRSLIIIFLVFSIAGLSLKSYIDTTTTIFAVDLSESTKNDHSHFQDFIKESLKYTSKKDKVGIVTFGGSTEVENAVNDQLKFYEFDTKPDERFTNIEKALKVSQGLMSEDTMKRIVLLTDGYENVDDSLKEGEIIKSNNVDLKVLKTKKNYTEEVQINKVNIPKRLHENQSFDITVEVYSNTKTDGKITLYSDQNIVGEKEVSLEKGINRFVFQDNAHGTGIRTYKASISAKNDTISQNNEYSAYTQIEGKANVLIISGANDEGRELGKILQSANIDVEHVRDYMVPSSLDKLSRYNSIIMSDVSLENVSEKFISALEKYVKDYGGGLVVTGGENSYALGGYQETLIEKMLPVNMEMKVKGEIPSLGLMLVIDKSGSMSGVGGEDKLEVAKDASIKAVDTLKSSDKVGVIAFNDTVHWVTKMSSVKNKDKIKNNIGTIRADGGTSILPALEEAYEELKTTNTKLKHIILLTDGQSSRTGYEELLENMKKDNITVSTVAVGGDADTQLLEMIAEEGRGRYYFADEYSSIPKIFTKETSLASKSYINNRSFIPELSQPHDIATSLKNGIPQIDGYIGTSEKKLADVILKTDKQDPLLASWQYGLGKTVAWTSDVNGRWSSSYLGTNEGTELFRNMVQWTFPNVNNKNLSIESKTIGNKEEIIVKNTGKNDNSYKTKATIVTPELKTINIDLQASKPGEFKGTIPIKSNGVYTINVNQYKDDKIVNSAKESIAINYPKEYDYTSLDNKIDTLVKRSNGKFITKPKDVFKNDLERIYGLKDLSYILLILALLLMLLDIALRRLNIKFKKLEVIGEKLHEYKSEIKSKSKSSKRKAQNSFDSQSNTAKSDINLDDVISSNNKKDDNVKKKENTNNKKNEDNSLDTSRLLKTKNKKKG
ncbi:Mg-chelatase subunit ChlD [Gottschalkia purinilytica]|uniref:Mg-chelatase subunit ChlD n=1 Tax=Gottschalkia purinilytica TaxID=1503 RepID=A0A0L0W9M5_GOTPU|nr:VWA domain-containing protein [Gottschalkia purinilytica]KNF08147.1 Mg-chelatase subunit ChlD [Gottschalkia purinilytica]